MALFLGFWFWVEYQEISRFNVFWELFRQVLLINSFKNILMYFRLLLKHMKLYFIVLGLE